MSNTPADLLNFEKLVHDAESLVERRSPEAFPLAEKLVSLALENSDVRYQAYAKYILAFYQCIIVNDYDRSIELCNEVLQIAATADEVTYKIHMTMGNAFQLKGEVFSAQESYLKGMKWLENKGELNQREKGFLASFYYNLSVLLDSNELNISMANYLEKAISIYVELGSSFKLSKSYVAYAGILERKGKYENAITILYKALEIDQQINDPYSIALSKANLGILYLRIDDNKRAIGFLTDALKYFEDNNMLYEVAMVKVNYGETLFATGKKKEGINTLYEAEVLFFKQENKRELSRLYETLAQFLSDTGDFRMALGYQKKYTECLKYFFDTDKTTALTRAKKEFETEQKEKEAALLKEKNEEIKTYVHKLESSNNELKQFAHVASHDMREPLRMISSYMSLLKRSLGENLTEQQTEFIAYAVDGAKRMEQLIVDLLRLAKVDANPRIEKVKLENVVNEIRMNLYTLIEEKEAEIATNGLPEIMADRTQMLQLFQNLIGNGMKYNEHEKPRIDIVCRFLKHTVEISIADNGIGIPEAHREKVFEIFQRLHTKKQYSGSGIGLAICRKIVDSLNGRIWVEENPTGGTVFKISFPNSICLV